MVHPSVSAGEFRIRGVLSQGLLMPTHYLTAPFEEGQDVSQVLGIQKWENTTPDGSLSQPFPDFLHKTDQERVQNIPREVLMGYSRETFEVTEKLDGSSMTVFVRGDESGVCSRNRLIDPSDCSSKFIEAAKKYGLVEKIRQTGRNLALQGELIGDSIQGNPYKILGHRFYVFDIFDIDNDCYLPPSERRVIVSYIEVRHVPVISADAFLPEGIDSILSLADGNSELNRSVNREGLVFKGDNGFSFKAISNNWLLRTGK